MSETQLVTHCAPTLAGIKTGSLFCCSCSDVAQAEAVVRRWNSILNAKGVYAVVLRYRKGRALIYVYRRSQLERDLAGREVRRLLERCGYAGRTLPEMLERLAERLRENQEFPHEIGVFLGYPLRDVLGFIRNHGKNYTCLGQWKAYGDERNAQLVFDRYRKCTAVYCRRHEEGTPLMRLTVAS